MQFIYGKLSCEITSSGVICIVSALLVQNKLAKISLTSTLFMQCQWERKIAIGMRKKIGEKSGFF